MRTKEIARDEGTPITSRTANHSSPTTPLSLACDATRATTHLLRFAESPDCDTTLPLSLSCCCSLSERLLLLSVGHGGEGDPSEFSPPMAAATAAARSQAAPANEALPSLLLFVLVLLLTMFLFVPLLSLSLLLLLLFLPLLLLLLSDVGDTIVSFSPWPTRVMSAGPALPLAADAERASLASPAMGEVTRESGLPRGNPTGAAARGVVVCGRASRRVRRFGSGV
jgi:hypothetical protein